MMAVKTVGLTMLLGFAVVLTPSSALAAGGSIQVSPKRLVYSGVSTEFVRVVNNSNSDVTTGDPVLSGDTTAFTWTPDSFSDECSTARPTIGPSGPADCFYDFQFNPPSAGKFKATAFLPVGDRTLKVTLVGTSP
jgi:hypothetical protein